MERRLTSGARGERSDFQFKGKLRSIKREGMWGDGVGCPPTRCYATWGGAAAITAQWHDGYKLLLRRDTDVRVRGPRAVPFALMKSPLGPLD